MSLTGLVFAELRARAFTHALHMVMLALGVAAAIALILFTGQMSQRLERDASNIDLVVGAKGSPLQLTLAAVYHADIPTGNIPYAAYERLKADPRVTQAIPVGLGDTVRGYRLVGAPNAYAALYGAKLAAGRLPAAPLETALGAETAARLGLKLGDTFFGAHGLGEGGSAHEDHPYIVVGVFAPTGAVIDRVALTPLESVWKVHESHGPLEGPIGGLQGPALPAKDDDDHDHNHDHDHDHDDAGVEKPANDVTAVLLSLRSPIAGPLMKRELNQGTALLAARPADEAARLFALVGAGAEAFRAFAFVLIGAALLSVFATLLSALNDRRGEIALLRAMGATRGAVFGVLLAQGLIIAAVGTLLGLALGHGLAEIIAATSAQARGFGLTGLAWRPEEAWVVLGGLAAGALAAAIPAIAAYRTDIARTLSEAG